MATGMGMASPIGTWGRLVSDMLADAGSKHRRTQGPFAAVRVLLSAAIGIILVSLSLLEVVSQLPNGKPSPVQLPPLTTRTTLQLSPDMREKLVREDVNSAQTRSLAQTARRRLADEPLDATALWLWSSAQEAYTRKQALSLAQRVSLREAVVQLQLMRMEAAEGNLPASLSHLDNALLVSNSAAPQMLRALSKGLDQPNFLKLLKPYVGRSWYKVLVEQAVFHAPNPLNAAGLLLQSDISSHDWPPELITSLVTRLILSDNYDAAKVVVNRVVGLRESSFNNFALVSETTVPAAAPLSWDFSADAGLVVKPVEDGIVFDLQRGFGGPLMARITNFSPGSYTIRQAIAASTSDLTTRWELQCLDNKAFKPAWSQAMPLEQREQVYDINVNIDPACSVQRWEIVNINESVESQATITIKGLRLFRR